MRQQLLTAVLLLWCATLTWGQGVPFIRNFSRTEYHGNSLNYDIEIGHDGTVFIANFEGVLYYDGVEWRVIYTPGITRITVIFRDSEDVLWVGGYDFFGRIVTKANGELGLESIADAKLFHGEVLEIWEQDGIRFLVSDGNLFYLKDGKVTLAEKVGDNLENLDMLAVIQTDSLDKCHVVMSKKDIIQEEPIEHGQHAIVTKNHGFFVTDAQGKRLYSITEDNGLCSDNISYVAYNGNGMLWGATENGLFCAAVQSAFMRFTANEGLRGAVQCITLYDGHIYAGTIDGLFRLSGNRFEPVAGVGYGCWQLCNTSHGLLAATANGVYCLSPVGGVRQLTGSTAMSLFVDDDGFYTGSLDALHYISWSTLQEQVVVKHEKVTKILRDGEGTLWICNLYGEVMCKKRGSDTFVPYQSDGGKTMSTIVPYDNRVEVVTVDDSKPFAYPLCTYLNRAGVLWLTNSEGKKLYRWHDGERLHDINELLAPLSDVAVRTLYQNENQLWIGTDNGVIVLNLASKDSLLRNPHSQLRFRSVVLNGDSILWGGYGNMPRKLPQLSTTDRNLRFTFAVDYVSMVGKTLYRYKLNNQSWSAWSEDQDAEFLGLSSGEYTITIQALLANGHTTDEVSMEFFIPQPFYLRWYMNVIYVLLMALLIYALMRYRLIRLEKEKQRLESIVQERTAEVVSQKDEIEQKSVSLEKALAELHDAQGELIRQEKMATVGKLTQGLIDRILNPLNYINNFSKLSEGLVQDVEANIEDEKEAMSAENYEDTMDVLGMLRGNLQKVGEHGQHTTRTLKAMEEMLKDRSGGITTIDIVALLQQNLDMLNTYFAKDISAAHIQTSFDSAVIFLPVNANAEQLSKTFMSLLANSVYAVMKKAQRTSFVPVVKITATSDGQQATITFYDNGIGIEETIINKVFDPFFTTKTTAEAAGVGLYLSREIIQNYGGDISVRSRKDDFTEFTITLPLIKS